jgi:hypothetical protein
MFAAATGPADLNQRLEAAFPSYGGTAMQGQQDFYLYPGRGRKPLRAGLSSLADAHSAPGNRRSEYREIMAW